MEQDEIRPPRHDLVVLVVALPLLRVAVVAVVVAAVAAFVSAEAAAWRCGPDSRTPRAGAWQSAAARRRFVISPSPPRTWRSSPGNEKNDDSMARVSATNATSIDEGDRISTAMLVLGA